ncbi:long chain acyl-CoA synthetase 6, peroxisomal-like [Durio zibethinus]|uniref:Long-chain-fatty-acid--CoA ligase n=1 Tax=Durio zibethinus TaxID=66656 RepID=A0A6P5X411_DURZI|nr:long chain acyl-CoA synthetase 6, peroxisomal-like [Durio zibethinus]
MDSTKAQRRLYTIHGHLVSDVASAYSHSDLRASPTACEFVSEQGYSVVLPEKLQTGKWNVYRSARSPLKLVTRFPDHPDISTLHENFVYAVDTFQDYKYLGTRIRVDGTVGEYKWMTYGEAGAARAAIGSGLIYHGIPKGSCVGIYFINRPEWLIVDHACSAYSLVSVPLYDTLGPDAVKYIVNHADVKAIFCVPQTLNSLLRFLSEIPSVCLVVVVGGFDNEVPSLPSSTGILVVTYSKLLSQGRSNLRPFCPPKPDDVATICYTSGTTGTPKGVLLTHGNLIASVAGFSITTKFNPTDVFISYLPLAHIYERAMQISLLYFGVAVGFYQGDNMKLMDDMVALRPTLFCSVPRQYNRIYAGIVNAVKSSGPLKERLFNAAYNSKKQAIMNGKSPSPMWDRLVFNKIKAKLGGRVRFMGSGAAPLSPDVSDFLKICFDCPVVEGYGMTETSCVVSCMDESDILSGHVGSPSPACEIKLVDVPEMNYTSDDLPYPRGEICVRGPIVFQGYFKDEVQTREVLDEDGWLHTGDIGLWLTGGRLKIIDRKKNIFKLAQGEYIAPEKIENVYAKCKFIAQCFIYGDSLNSSLVAVVSVDQDVLKAWAASEGIKFKELGQLCNDPRARAAVLAEMDAVGREAQLRGFEFAKAVALVLEPFTVENGLLTPTFKIKRPQAREYFAKAISNMCAELATSDPSPRI